jgi:hypothetical protein
METTMRGPALDVKTTILDRMDARAPFGVWTPVDFVDAAPRDAVDQALHRLARTGQVRRIARGLYDRPRPNSLTRRPNVPDPRAVIDALGRRDNARMLVDGVTAANDLGLSDAVPARVVVHTDARLTPVDLGPLHISFRKTAPSKLYWAGRPAMRVVQALHWLRDKIPADGPQLRRRLARILADPGHGQAIAADLREGLPALPAWMQDFLRPLLQDQAIGAGAHG